MDFLNSTELAVPLSQIALLLIVVTVALLFGRIKLALLINYLFTLYWGYFINREYLLGSSLADIDAFTVLYFGFGIVVVVFALIGFLSHSYSRA